MPGRPTSFWFNRQYPPNFSIYPVTPPFAPIVQNPPVPPLPPSFYYGFQAYRLRQIQDANPINGQVPDLPPRAWNAFASASAAALAEKWKPAQHQAKIMTSLRPRGIGSLRRTWSMLRCRSSRRCKDIFADRLVVSARWHGIMPSCPSFIEPPTEPMVNAISA